MKQLYYILLLCSAAFTGCRQLSDSVAQTLHPHVSAPGRPADNQAPPPAAVVQEHTSHTSSTTQTVSTSSSVVTMTTTSHPDAMTRPRIPLLADTGKLSCAERALQRLPQYAGKEIYLYASLHFYDDGSIIAQLQHPVNPAYVDRYHYTNGAWSKPEAVQLSTRDNTESRLMPLRDFHFADAARMLRTYNEQAATIEGAQPENSVYISIRDGGFRWFPGTINGSRERYAIQFNADGTLRDFHQE